VVGQQVKKSGIFYERIGGHDRMRVLDQHFDSREIGTHILFPANHRQRAGIGLPRHLQCALRAAYQPVDEVIVS
jgi:hypothetical protein